MFLKNIQLKSWIHSFSNYKIGHEERSLIQDLTDGNLASSQDQLKNVGSKPTL